MAKSVGEIALDIVLGKESFSSSIKNAVSECAKTLNSSSATIGQKISSIGNCVSGLGATILPVSTAIGGLGVTIGKMSMNFEDAMAKVSTIADTTEVPLDTLKDQIMKLSTQTGISASEIADNVYNAISAGQKTGDAVNFVSNATKLAKAGFTSSASSLDVLTTIMNAYGLEAEKVTDVSDMLIQTQNLGKTTVDELSSSMGKVIPTANSMNVGLDNLCASYSIMTAKGIATAETTTYMNSMLNELGKSGTKVSDALKSKTGKSFKELMAEGKSLGDVLQILKDYADENKIGFNDLWGSAEAGKAGISLLSDGVDSFNSRLGEMNKSTGMTDVAFKKMQTKSYSLEKSINQIKNVAIQLGDTLMQTLGPIIEQICSKISKFTEWFSKLDDGTKNTIVKIGLFVTALGPLLIGIGKVIAIGGKAIGVITSIAGFITSTLIPALGSLFAFIVANPIVLVIGAIVGAIILLVTHWNEVKEVITNVWTSVCEAFQVGKDFVVGVFNSIVTGIQNFISSVISFVTNFVSIILSHFTNTISSIQTIFSGLATFLSGIFELIKNIILAPVLFICDIVTGNFDKLKSDAINIFNNIKDSIGNILTGTKDIVVGIVSTIVNFWIEKFNYAKEAISNIVNGIKNTAVNVFNNMKNSVLNTANNMKNAAVNTFNNMKTGISNTIGNIKNSIVNGFNSAINWIKGLPGQALSWGSDIVGNIASGIKNSVSKVTNAVKSVANKIRSFLHFSEPDVGPLSDFHTYMPDMMDLMSKGIKANTSEVMKTVNGLASEMSNALCIEADTPEIKATSASINPIASQNQNTSSNDTLSAKLDSMMTLMSQLLNNKQVATDTGDITIPVYIGNTAIDEIIVTAQQRRTMRSGGKS